jgi:hypothetical protein
MTYQQILWAIDSAAELAAKSALDAFPDKLAADFPTAEMALEVVNGLYDDGAVERPSALPEFFTRQFAADYRQHLQTRS